MRVFVAGVNGYIGAVPAPHLMECEQEVVGLDVDLYRNGWLFSDNTSMRLQPFTIKKDQRDITPADLECCDAVARLAELSNAPLGENSPRIAYEINHGGSIAIAEAARKAEIRRFVYTSSRRVYGAGSGDFLEDATAPNPQTAYANYKVLVERDLGQMTDSSFCPEFLRDAIAYGPSTANSV